MVDRFQSEGPISEKRGMSPAVQMSEKPTRSARAAGLALALSLPVARSRKCFPCRLERGDVEPVFGKQSDEVVARNAARDLRVARTDIVCVLVAQVSQPA